MDKINCFINNFNLITWPKAMVEYLKQIKELNLIIIDNNSTYKPLLDWYDTEPCQIIRLDQNLGHLAPHITNLTSLGNNDYYIITDPDLDLSGIPLDFLDIFIKGMEDYEYNCKVGFSIEINDIPKESPVFENVQIWEPPFWKDKIENTLYYNAPIDTTFAIYSKERGGNNLSLQTGIRTDRPYTVRHMPFYITNKNLTEELCYYFESTNSSSSITKHILPLIKEYRNVHNSM